MNGVPEVARSLLSGPIYPRAKGQLTSLTQLPSGSLSGLKELLEEPHFSCKTSNPFHHRMRRTYTLPAGFQLAFTVLLAIMPVRICWLSIRANRDM